MDERLSPRERWDVTVFLCFLCTGATIVLVALIAHSDSDSVNWVAIGSIGVMIQALAVAIAAVVALREYKQSQRIAFMAREHALLDRLEEMIDPMKSASREVKSNLDAMIRLAAMPSDLASDHQVVLAGERLVASASALKTLISNASRLILTLGRGFAPIYNSFRPTGEALLKPHQLPRTAQEIRSSASELGKVVNHQLHHVDKGLRELRGDVTRWLMDAAPPYTKRRAEDDERTVRDREGWLRGRPPERRRR